MCLIEVSRDQIGCQPQMLIVTADDLGRSIAATDAIMTCFAQGRISATSAMVFMADSDRAAALAKPSGLPVGLHVNFSEPLTGDSVPAPIRQAHDRIRTFLTSNKYALLLFNPLLVEPFRVVFEAQLSEFERLYGRLPSHVDGHQHLHLATNVLLQRLMPEGAIVRRNFSFRSGEKGAINRWYRSIVDRHLRQRHRTTDYFFSLTHHLTPELLARVIALSTSAKVELMAHPERQEDFEFLMGETFKLALARTRLAGPDAPS